MKQKKGFILREVCGEKVIIAEGVEVVNFNKLLSLNESAAYLWQQAALLGDFTAEQLADKLWLMTPQQLHIGTPHELAAQGVLSTFIEHEGIVFDTNTLTIQIRK